MTTININKRQLLAKNDSIRNAKKNPGQELPNGAVILAQRRLKEQDHGDEYLVLAVQPGFQPFVVWRRLIGTQHGAVHEFLPLDYCWAGGYHRDLADAIREYEERT
jgi:hypothetical protein